MLGDGMADRPLPELEGRTPLMAAKTPNMDSVSSRGTFGYVTTAAPGFPAGSDIMNMNIMGYDPSSYYTGRAPIEAAGMGIELGRDDVAFRCNLVTLKMNEGRVFMHDYSAGHISEYEGDNIIRYLDEFLGKGDISFYPGKSYRHLMVWQNGPDGLDLTPPHDIMDKEIAPYIPKDDSLLELTEKSWTLLRDHPANQLRNTRGQMPANSIWLWGEGKPPQLPTYAEKYGLEGVMVSAVDLLKGLGKLAGLEAPEVEGATGYLDTKYENKVKAAMEGLESRDFAYLHVEAPDECGHAADVNTKIRAIEDFDRRVVGNVLEAMENLSDWRLLVMPDHATPIEVRTHVKDPVPFAVLSSEVPKDARTQTSFCETPQPEKHHNYMNSCEKLNEFFFRKG